MKYKSLIYERVALARVGKNPTVISQLSSGWLVLGDNQNIPGYCVFLSDPVVNDIQKLTIAQRSVFLSEMTIAGGAIQKAVNARPMNYSILGNADVGLHAHIHPRYDWEDERFKTKNPFKYYWENVPEVKFELQIHKELIIKIRNEIEVLRNTN